jgi:hypothetical protein
MFGRFEPSDTARSRELLDEVCASSRAEAQVAARRLTAIGELFVLRLRESGDSETWAVDTWAAVSAEVAAAVRSSVAMASSYLRYALAMRERLPRVAAVFGAGDIDYRMFQSIVYRTDLITDPAALAVVDAQLAVRAARWPSMTQARLAHAVDRVVAHVDPDARRRTRERVSDREVAIWDTDAGMAQVYASLYATDAQALNKRLDALADTVCAADPRSRAQRRADALGALAGGRDRLGCGCQNPDCPAGALPGAGSAVVIHVVAQQGAVQGRADADTPGYLPGGGLIPAELVAELARSARHRALIHPADTPPEPRYAPSQRLADFVRYRDLTCRAPGCDRPATDCDIDHTIAFSDGGATHASNLRCLCRPL